MMKKVFVLICSVIALASCSKDQNAFEWTADRVGHLTKEHMVSQLDSLYANDSIIRYTGDSDYSSTSGLIEVYEKGGAHLLTLTPYTAQDSGSKIEYVQIRDPRFKNEKGISLKSTFKEIAAVYKIGSIDRVITDAQVRLKDQNFYFTIPQEFLPESVLFDISAPIEATMIPDNATPDYLFVSW